MADEAALRGAYRPVTATPPTCAVTRLIRPERSRPKRMRKTYRPPARGHGPERTAPGLSRNGNRERGVPSAAPKRGRRPTHCPFV